MENLPIHGEAVQVADKKERLVVQLQQAKDLCTQAEHQHHLGSVTVRREETLLDTLNDLIECEKRDVAAQTCSLDGWQDDEKGGDLAGPFHTRIDNRRPARPMKAELLLMR